MFGQDIIGFGNNFLKGGSYEVTMRRKNSLLLTVVLLLSLLSNSIPAVASSALSGVVVGDVPVIAAQGPATLASIRFAESGASHFLTGSTMSVMLPAGMEFQTGLMAGSYYEATSNLTVSSSFSENNRKITYNFTRTSFLTEAAFLVKLPVLIIGSIPNSGDVAVTVTSDSLSITGSNIVTGGYGTLAVDVNITPSTVSPLSLHGSNPQTIARTISFTENGPGAIKVGDTNKIELVLSYGAVWANASYPVQVYPALPAGVTVKAVRDSGTGNLNLILSGGTTTAGTTFNIVNPEINIGFFAPEGDVTVEIKGTGENSDLSKSAVLGRITGWDVTTRRQTNVNPFEVIAGRQSQAMANIEVVEVTAGSLASGGNITLTLPSGLQFLTPPGVTYSGVGGTQPQIELNTDARTVSLNITESSIVAGNVMIHLNSSGNILVAPGFSGAVNINVAGTAGASGVVTVANVIRPVTISTLDVVDIPMNTTTLTGGEIVIEETAPGRIASGVIVLQLPQKIVFSSLPSVTLAGGNISFGLGSLSNSGSTLTIPINSRSTQPSKIVIGDINYSIDSSWWDTKTNKIEVLLTGNSLMDAAVSSAFSDSRDKLKVVNAESGAVKESVFTIGSKAYTIGRETKQMDQEPVIVSGRTMLPLRFVGEAVGLNDEEIYWDSVKRTVTLFRGDRVAQVTIGSKTLLINGAPIEMDVAPEIMNGRTMLPIRWIAMAVQASIHWNEADKAVTVTPN